MDSQPHLLLQKVGNCGLHEGIIFNKQCLCGWLERLRHTSSPFKMQSEGYRQWTGKAVQGRSCILAPRRRWRRAQNIKQTVNEDTIILHDFSIMGKSTPPGGAFQNGGSRSTQID
jgi:hypothetical protein